MNVHYYKLIGLLEGTKAVHGTKEKSRKLMRIQSGLNAHISGRLELYGYSECNVI